MTSGASQVIKKRHAERERVPLEEVGVGERACEEGGGWGNSRYAYTRLDVASDQPPSPFPILQGCTVQKG
jgi:hypothetical protein